jgi:hypothetical protein
MTLEEPNVYSRIVGIRIPTLKGSNSEASICFDLAHV